MLVLTKSIRTYSLLASLAIGFSTFALDAIGEKVEQTSVKSNPRIAFRTVTVINDVAGHEVGQELQISDIKFSSPSFKVKEEWVYNNFNYVAGSGPHRGMFIDTHEDGSQTFGTFEGAQKLVSNPDGSWAATWEGTYKYTGGSGKFKNIKGAGTYSGKASSAGDFREDAKETVEY